MGQQDDNPIRDHTVATVVGDGVRLACHAVGDTGDPTIVFVHGYPDTHAVRDRMVAELAADFHCVGYDVRGAGASSRPAKTAAYRLDRLRADLTAVIDWACPREPIHLVAHDWGSIQSWEAVTEPALAHRFAGFTSISGPCLDHTGHWARRQWRADRRALLGQLRRLYSCTQRNKTGSGLCRVIRRGRRRACLIQPMEKLS